MGQAIHAYDGVTILMIALTRRMNRILTPLDEPWTQEYIVKVLALVVVAASNIFTFLYAVFFGFSGWQLIITLFLSTTGLLAYGLARQQRIKLANILLASVLLLALLGSAAFGHGVYDFAYQGTIAVVLYGACIYNVRIGIYIAAICSVAGLIMVVTRHDDLPLILGYHAQLGMWATSTVFFVVSGVTFGFLIGSINKFHKQASAIRKQLKRTNTDLAHEIRQRRRAEDSLRSLVAHLPALLFQLDKSGIILFADGRGLGHLGFLASELVGRSLIAAFDGLVSEETLRTSLEHGQNIRVTLRNITLEGCLTPMTETEADSEAAQIALFIDVTEQALLLAKTSDYARDLERSNAELQQFAYVASHDLKEPLRSVSGFLNLALRQGRADVDPVVMDCIVQARDAAGRMQTLVTDLLAYARVGRQRHEPRKMDVNDLMALVLRDLRGAIDHSGAQVTWSELPTLTADPTQLLQVIENLVNNAVKFQSDRVPKIHISARRISSGWRFEIKDNGIGIGIENQRRIFQIFQRLHTREEFSGTGIGLALCRRIVEHWGGEIGVQSVVGEGSTFWFTTSTHDTSPTQPLRKDILHA